MKRLYFFKKIIFLAPILIFMFSCKKEDKGVKGCTDSNGSNYNSSATINEGCLYPKKYKILGRYVGVGTLFSDVAYQNQISSNTLKFSIKGEKGQYYYQADGGKDKWDFFDFSTPNNTQVAFNVTPLSDNTFKVNGVSIYGVTGSSQPKYCGIYEANNKKITFHVSLTRKSNGVKLYLKIEGSK